MSRRKLHEDGGAITTNSYYQPPNNITLSYPCIIYRRIRRDDYYANDKKYFGRQGYMVTVIDSNPDSTLPDKVLDLDFSRWENEYVNDNLYHTVFTVYS